MTDENRESEIALYLARRTYLYGVLHVVFGAQPTADVVRQMLGEETNATLRAVIDAAASEARCLRAESNGELVEAVRSLSDAATLLAGLGEADDVAALSDTLQSDYARLFDIPGESYVRTWESPYVGTEGTLFQASTLNVRGYYHEAGYKLQAEKHFPDDHIAAMMDYLRCMGERAYNEYADGDDAQVATTLGTQHRFLQQHVLTWVDVFAQKVAEHDDARGYYAAFAGAMAAFAHVDCACIEGLAKELSAA